MCIQKINVLGIVHVKDKYARNCAFHLIIFFAYAIIYKMGQTNLIFKRKAYKQMIEWKNQFAPHYVLFLQGARRVGKTTLAKEFGN